MSKYEGLLDRAKWGKLSEQEIADVADELQKSNPGADRYTLLHILGRAGAVSYQNLVECFLECQEDPMLARLALQTLCRYWNETDRYIEQVLQFVRGVEWDEGEYVRQMAVSIAGDYLRSHDEPRLLNELLRIFEREDEDRIIREDAYFALARAAGRDRRELPSAARHFDLHTDIDPSVVKQAHERLVAQEV